MKYDDQCEFCMLEKSYYPILPSNMQEIPVDNLCQDIIFTGDFFYVKPDISPVVENHLLIIPKKHVFCINDLSAIYKNELKDIKKRIIQYYNNNNMNYLFFEHGCCCEREPGSSCIHHAHLHAIPTTVDIEREIIKKVVSIVGFPTATPQKTTYLYCESESTDKPLYWNDEVQRSQLFRIIIADIVGFPNRARWQNCLINETERKRSEIWLEKFKGFSLI